MFPQSFQPTPTTLDRGLLSILDRQLASLPVFLPKECLKHVKNNFLPSFLAKYALAKSLIAQTQPKFFITPELLPNSHTVFLSYPLTIKENSPFNRMQLIRFLEEHQIQTRPLFTGNVLRHPAYRHLPHRQIGDLKNADFIMKHTFVLPCHHALTPNQLDYLFETYNKFLKKF